MYRFKQKQLFLPFALIDLAVNSMSMHNLCGIDLESGIPGVEQNKPAFKPGTEKLALSEATTMSQDETN